MSVGSLYSVAASGGFLNIDERNAVGKTGDNYLDLQAVTLTEVTEMQSSIIFPILMELTLIISYLLMPTQQY